MRFLAAVLFIVGILGFGYAALQYFGGVYESDAKVQVAAGRPIPVAGELPSSDSSREKRERAEVADIVMSRALYVIGPGAVCVLVGTGVWFGGGRRRQKEKPSA
jgi:hypothetical protein